MVEKESKKVLEREYIVPLRKGWLKVPKYKRGNKAVKTLKEFLARHMKIYDNDLRRIKLDVDLNNEIRFRGMKKPPAKIKVKAVKFEDGIVRVELIDLPVHIKFKRLREEKKSKANEKKAKTTPKVEKKETKTDEEKMEEKEKLEADREQGEKLSKAKAKEEKHVSKDKKVQINRKALAR
jgi:large subunit ribosomal protein L31e